MQVQYKEKLEQLKHDKEQYKAYLTNNNTVVLAGPGSGKTTVLTLKIMRLLRDEIFSPFGLACVTFSTQAAREFKERLNSYGFRPRKNIFLGTMHSFCIAEVLGPFSRLYPQYKIPPSICIISESKKHKLFKEVIGDLGLSNLGLTIEEMDRERKLNIAGSSQVQVELYDIASQAAVEYEKRLHNLGLVDFENIVNYSTKLIQEEDYVRKCLEAKFPWILIDEYQDLGRPLHEMMLALLVKTNIKIFAVGDPDQSIYSFQGAIPDYLLELCRIPAFECIVLKTNYRSNQGIIDASEIALQQKRHYLAGTRKEEVAVFDFVVCERDMNQQYEVILNVMIPRYLEMEIPFEEIAIVVGRNGHVKELAQKMEEAGIPYFISKHDFNRSDVVRWLEDCARWILDKKLTSFSLLFEFWISLLANHNKVRMFHDDIMECKANLYEVLTSTKIHTNNVYTWLNQVINELNLRDILKGSERFPDEIDNLDTLLVVAQEAAFINYDLTKFTKIGKSERQVTISTRHSSKGLEFEAIIILGLEEEQFPSYYALKNQKKLMEERRVFFVCISRAKKVCCLVRSTIITIKKRDGDLWEKTCKASRFWSEIYQQYGSDTNVIKYKSDLAVGENDVK